jgi:hypothetical protein
MKKLLVALLCGACAITVPVVFASASGSPGHAQVAKKKCKKSKSAVAAKKKCKKKKAPAPTVVPPATTTPTGPLDSDGDGVPDSSDNCAGVSNAGQADADVDGHGDACDPCPLDSNPGAQGCPASIYDINQGIVPNGSNVRITNALVTAVMPDDSALWVQIKSSDVGYTGTAYAGLEVNLNSVSSLPTLAVGNRLTIDGITGSQILNATAVTVTSASIEPIEYASATPTVFEGGTVDSTFNGQFVNINGTTAYAGNTLSGWTTSHGFGVGNRIIGTLPNCAAGSALGLQGLADLVSGDLVLLPRNNADITCVKLSLDTEVCVGATDVPIGTVNLGYPVANDTVVTMVSNDTGKLTVSNTTVPTGFSSFSVVGTAMDTGSVTVTATLNGVSTQDTIDVVGAPIC